MIGTLVNVGAVLLGGIIGLVLQSKIASMKHDIIFDGIGLFTIALGVSMAIQSNHFIFLILSIVLGSLIGEWIKIEESLEKLGDKLKVLLKSDNSRFSEGLVTSFLIFCVGSMTILGAIEEGLGGKPNLLLAKSVMDGFGAIAFASILGIGVLFSVIPLLLYQGGLTLLAALAKDFFSEALVTEISAVGGLLLLGLGINLLNLKKIKVANMLPALVIIVILFFLFN